MGGGGGILSPIMDILSPVTDVLFGKPAEPDIPAPVTPTQVDSTAVSPASEEGKQAATNAAEAEVKRLKKMKGNAATVATSQQGLLTEAPTTKKQLLGT